MLRDLKVNEQKVEKPILDEYQLDEFEQKICLAMEFSYQLKVKTWEKGFFKCYTGLIHRLDATNKSLFIEQEEHIINLSFSDIVSLELENE
ncbi:YolD-like family protein [Fredinandcohnia quinoae]|uniref:YolD-like family protein n=1 Tax=Fredinandcohnia quinoae TaxID=2918902 RepID=A0AAW5E2W3_9BACI|nr:YolD-like family protein [Fredinandcohnia sp. SECRCQ15]MCH1627241.1 YolD-like family protein [Fredinandcohnia sp. SECRCQ15]